MRQNDQRIYRTFEEFEREELRRTENDSHGAGGSVDDMIAALFSADDGGEVAFEATRKRPSPWEDEEEE
jgi:hypothetical protein